MDSKNKPMICVPGQRLCLIDNSHSPGIGTYELQGYIHSSLVGFVKIIPNENGSSQTIEVHSIKEQTIVPAAGDIVTAKVMVLNQRFCKCSIQCIGSTVLKQPHRAILRKEDIGSMSKEQTDMYKCYRPGDIILAKVLPLKEVHFYHLTTAENELGVVIAHSEEGVPMIPLSWTEMQCPKTHAKEPRKVAKVIPETIPVEL